MKILTILIVFCFQEFSYWFNNPLNSMVEGNRNVNNDLIARLHTIMRPFLLRRLKKDVAKQLPGKYEHIVMCRLSKRQLFLYEEFMARSTF
jgi:E1A-binding protein p400